MCRQQKSLFPGLLALAVLSVADVAWAGGNAAAKLADSRPDPDGRATRVSLGVYVVDVPEIDDAKRTFTADLYLLLHWKDARLSTSDDARSALPLGAVWHPDILILNQRSANRLLPEVVSVDRQGRVEYRQRIQGTFSAALNLRSFPLDEQTFTLRFVCPRQSPAELELVPDDRSGRAPEFSILDWTIRPPAGRAEPLATPNGSEVAGFTFVLAGQRRAGAYFYQFVIPLTFIVCMSWAAFWMAPEQFGPRQGIAVTSMLTVIAYRFILANQLPRVAYLTRFDYLLLGCTTLVFLVLVEVVTAHGLMTKGYSQRARRLDVGARYAFPILFLALLVGVWAL